MHVSSSDIHFGRLFEKTGVVSCVSCDLTSRVVRETLTHALQGTRRMPAEVNP